MRTRGNNRGFSLLEVVIVIVIIGILAAIALPIMSQWVPSRRLKAASRDITSVLAQAKAEAIRRGEQVTVTFDYRNSEQSPQNSKLSAEPQLFVMYMDTGEGGNKRSAVCEEDEEVLLQSGSIPNRVKFDSITCNDNSLAFNSRAIPVNAKTGAMSPCSIRLCLDDGKGESVAPCRKVDISRAGRIKVEFD